jgi:lipopolysaccharide export LptBFGC system permease protein LptF
MATYPQAAGMRPGRLLLAAFAGAVLVAGITTP